MPSRALKFFYDIQYVCFNRTEELENEVLEYLAKLEKLSDRIQACHVSITGNKSHRGMRFKVGIRLEIPGESIMINHKAEQHYSKKAVHLTVRDSFISLYALLEKKLDRLGGHPNHRIAPNLF